jgi:selenocysteine lyase/cysteine desulfurase
MLFGYSRRIAASTSFRSIRFCSVKEVQAIKPAYLDFQATTPIDYRVLDAMLPYMTGMFGNPHSRTHAYGWEAEAAVDNARV